MQQTRIKLVLLLVAAATLGIYVFAFTLSTTRDRVDQLDSDALTAAATSACVDLRTEIDAMAPLLPGALPAARSARVDAQESLVRRFVERVSAVGDEALAADEPARQWLADWTRLAGTREAYARAGFAGTFAVPVEDGRPITTRMDAIGVDACAVPLGLTTSP